MSPTHDHCSTRQLISCPAHMGTTVLPPNAYSSGIRNASDAAPSPSARRTNVTVSVLRGSL